MCGFNHHIGRNIENLKGIKIQDISFFNKLKLVKIKSTPYKHSSILRQLNHMIFDFITAIKILFSKNIKCVILSVPPVSNFNVWVIRLKKIKLITDVEDLWPLFLQDMGISNKAIVYYLEKSANYIYNSSAGIDAVSNGMLSFVRKKIKNKEIITWLAPLGVNLELYNVTKNNNIFEQYKWKNDFKIIYIGAHGKANDIENVLYTIQSIKKKYTTTNGKKISFVFIGDGDNKENLINIKEELKLDNVYFENSISSKNVPAYLISADVCLTNLRKVESFKLVRPNKLFQYMAAKKPIICGIWGESKEIIEKSCAGIYVDFTDYDRASISIINFIKDSDKLEKCSMDGYDYIKKNGDRNLIFENFYIYMKEIIEMERKS